MADPWRGRGPFSTAASPAVSSIEHYLANRTTPLTLEDPLHPDFRRTLAANSARRKAARSQVTLPSLAVLQLPIGSELPSAPIVRTTSSSAQIGSESTLRQLHALPYPAHRRYLSYTERILQAARKSDIRAQTLSNTTRLARDNPTTECLSSRPDRELDAAHTLTILGGQNQSDFSRSLGPNFSSLHSAAQPRSDLTHIVGATSLLQQPARGFVGIEHVKPPDRVFKIPGLPRSKLPSVKPSRAPIRAATQPRSELKIGLEQTALSHKVPLKKPTTRGQENSEFRQEAIQSGQVGSHQVVGLPAQPPEAAAELPTNRVTDMEVSSAQPGAQSQGQGRPSPFPPLDQVPLHRNPPLAPSQELAYREKCIQLRRRITEIEANNDTTKALIAAEKRHHQKMRLNRAILLDKVREIMENKGGQPITMEQLKEMLGPELTEDPTEDLSYETLQANSRKRRRTEPGDEELLDDYSTETDEEDPEPVERPVRTRRQNDSAAPRDVVMGNAGAAPNTLNSSTAMYQQSPSGLPNLAPAGAIPTSFSPTSVAKDPAILTSSFRVNSGTPVAASAQPSWPQQQQSALQGLPPPLSTSTPIAADSGLGYVIPAPRQPVRPAPPFEQFTEHMRPQLIRDNYPQDQIHERINHEWQALSDENKGLWDQRYQEQMVEYEAGMDEYRRWERNARK